jgi:hypothetical protein
MLHARGLHAAGVKNVLVVFPEEAWTAHAYRTIYNALKSKFDETRQNEVTLFGESLDLYLFPDGSRQQYLAEFLREKFSRMKIDLLIPVAPSSLSFVLRTRDTIFPGIPVVYCGEVAHGDKRLEHRNDVTGTALTLDIVGTIDLARRVQPGLKRIAAVAGTSMVDEYLLSLFRGAFQNYEGELELIDLTGLPLNRLLDNVSGLPASTAIIYIGFQRDADRRVSLCVSDTGPGISTEVVKKLFEPFFTTKPQGLGLGLSICRSIAEAHGGSLSFGSNPEKGAVFCLHLPVGSPNKAKCSSGGPIDAG